MSIEVRLENLIPYETIYLVKIDREKQNIEEHCFSLKDIVNYTIEYTDGNIFSLIDFCVLGKDEDDDNQYYHGKYNIFSNKDEMNKFIEDSKKYFKIPSIDVYKYSLEKIYQSFFEMNIEDIQKQFSLNREKLDFFSKQISFLEENNFEEQDSLDLIRNFLKDGKDELYNFFESKGFKKIPSFARGISEKEDLFVKNELLINVCFRKNNKSENFDFYKISTNIHFSEANELFKDNYRKDYFMSYEYYSFFEFLKFMKTI